MPYAYEPIRQLHATDLRAIALEAERVTADSLCPCGLQKAVGWESVPDERWPSHLMELVGTLRDGSLDEPTFEEFHPAGTRYDSPMAPIAVDFFPFNRCNVYRCSACSLPVLRYTEFGGYYVDHRARCVRSALVADL